MSSIQDGEIILVKKITVKNKRIETFIANIGFVDKNAGIHSLIIFLAKDQHQ